jgi:PAS domain S-box-containing protein
MEADAEAQLKPIDRVLSAFIDMLPYGVCICHAPQGQAQEEAADLILQSANPPARRFLDDLAWEGRRLGEVLPTLLMSTNDGSTVAACLIGALQSGNPQRPLPHNLPPSGMARHLEPWYSGHCVPLDASHVAMVFEPESPLPGATLEQITAVFAATDDAMYTLSPDARILSWNEGAARLYGYLPEDIYWQSFEQLQAPDRKEETHQLLMRSRLGEKFNNFETQHLHRDGSRIDVSLSINPLQGEQGFQGLFVVARDIGIRRRQERQLRHYARELEHQNSDLEQFAFAISHDLRGPLHTVNGYIELLQRRFGEDVGERTQELFGKVLRGTQQMQSMIDDLLTFAQLQTGEVRVERVDLNRALNEVLQMLERQIAENDARVSNPPLPTISANAAQMKLLLQNLLGNAIKYRREEPPRIRITATRIPNAWLFAVGDNGIGIEADDEELAFRLFKRLDQGRSKPGSGLGLALCRTIVQRHGGRIWYESEPGVGTTFFFTIPDSVGSE